MNTTSRSELRGYHYTNPGTFASMQTGRDYGVTGLLPLKRFVHHEDGNGLPEEAYDAVVEALLEPDPPSWRESQEFLTLWKYLMHDISLQSSGEVTLLSFPLEPRDRAYIVERAHVERVLGQDRPGHDPTREAMDDAYRRYWESRVSVFDYNGGYSLPQLTLWSPIEVDRLSVEWTKPKAMVLTHSP